MGAAGGTASVDREAIAADPSPDPVAGRTAAVLTGVIPEPAGAVEPA